MPPHEREITLEQVQTWCREFGVVSFIETSAKTSENVITAFVLAVREWKRSERNTDLTDGGDTIDLTQAVHLNAQSKSSCCSGTRNRQQQTHHEVLQ